jgi:hypothetical protein
VGSAGAPDYLSVQLIATSRHSAMAPFGSPRRSDTSEGGRKTEVHGPSSRRRCSPHWDRPPAIGNVYSVALASVSSIFAGRSPHGLSDMAELRSGYVAVYLP